MSASCTYYLENASLTALFGVLDVFFVVSGAAVIYNL